MGRSWRSTCKLFPIFIILMIASLSDAKPIRSNHQRQTEDQCADWRSVDLLGITVQSPDSVFRGIQVRDHAAMRGYWFDADEYGVGASGVRADEAFGCPHFPRTFTILFTICKPTYRSENEFLFTLIAEDRQNSLVSLRMRRDRIFLDFRPDDGDDVTIGFRDSRLNDGEWHTYALTLAPHQARLLIDCECASQIDVELNRSGKIGLRKRKLYLASRRNKKGRFTGLIRQLMITPDSNATDQICRDGIETVNQVDRGDRSSSTFINDQMYPASASTAGGSRDCEEEEAWRNGTISSRRGSECSETHPIRKRFERLDYVSEFGHVTTASKSMDMEIFELEGEGTFLASANQGRDRNRKSAVYKWTGAGFSFYQDLTTSKAQDFEFFTVDGDQYLAVANHGEIREKNVFSVIYRWHPQLRTFTPHQFIPTIRARFIKTFTIDGKLYMATANNDSRPNYKDTSCVYVWKPKLALFKRYQTLHTSMAYDAEHFVIGSEHFLAMANYFKGVTTRTHSVIYRWMRSGFEPSQYIETAGALDWEYFSISGKHFLAVANSFDKSENRNSVEVDSLIYCYDEKLMMFVEFQKIPTYSAQDMEFFTLGRDSFIVAASASDKKKELENIVYRWQGVEGFVPVHWVKTPPSSDWEKFRVDDGRHFMIAASVSSSERESKIFHLITF